jgi:hypothetical protein
MVYVLLHYVMIKCLICSTAGLFCMHLVKAFTHLQVEKNPSKYILECYTRGVRSVVEWDRNDVVKGGPDGSNELMRFAKLVPVVMGIARAGANQNMCMRRHWKDLKLLETSLKQFQLT